MFDKLFKKILIACIIISLIFSFNSYTNSGSNLDDQSYVMAIGIDVGDTSDYKISLQLSTLESSATEGSMKSDKSSSGGGGEQESSSSGSTSEETSKYIIYTVDSNSIDNAINIADAYLNKNIDLSHCKILLISEDVAKNGISSLVNSITNKVKIRPDCNIIISQVPQNEFENKDASRTFSIRVTGKTSANVRVKIKGVDTRNEAEALIGTEFYVSRDKLPELGEEEYYLQDLIGLKVCLKTPDEVIGKVSGFYNFGAGDIIELKLDGQKQTEMLPFTRQYVPEINIAQGYVIVSSATMIFAKDDDDAEG